MNLENYDTKNWTEYGYTLVKSWDKRMVEDFTEYHSDNEGSPSEFETFLENIAERAQAKFFSDYHSSDTPVVAYGQNI